MSLFKCIFLYTFLKQVRSGVFRVVTVVIGAAIILMFALTKLMNSSESKVTINVIDETGSFSNIIELNEVLESSEIKMMNEELSDDEVKQFVNDEEDNIVIKLYEDSEKNYI